MCVSRGVIAPQDDGRKGHSVLTKSSPSALRRTMPLIVAGYLFNTICYFAVYAILPTDLVSSSTKNSPDEGESCSRRDLFAFQVVSFFNLSYLGLLGFFTWYVSRRASKALPQTPQGRYFGNALGKGVLLPEADQINAVIVIFQGWDFFASIPFVEHCTPIMMAHHFLAFMCGFFCLWYEVNPYYAVYFGGVCEFSSIFLSIAQLFEYYPPSCLVAPTSSLASVLPALQLFCQGMFVVTFFLFRIVGWTAKSYNLLTDASYIIKNELMKRYSPGSDWFLWYLLTMSGLLGVLQVYWFGEIMGKVLEILNG